MSILNGNISSDVVFPISMPFGAEMKETTCIPELSVTVAALNEHILICGGRGVISLYSIDQNGKSEKISDLKIFGNARQIGVYEDFAYVSTRESGVCVCDLKDPKNPILAHQIDSLELATGIAVTSGVLAITNRHMGCELYDVCDPYHPKRLGEDVDEKTANLIQNELDEKFGGKIEITVINGGQPVYYFIISAE